ncbi:YncE family protein [Corynebacterium flavescens]
MKLSSSRLAGRRALASLATAALLSTGTAVVAPAALAAPIDGAAAVVAAQSGPRPGSGAGELTASSQVEQGGLITISGTGFLPRLGGELGLKLNDGALKFPSDQNGSDVTSVDAAGTAYIDGDNVPGADGAFTATVRVSSDLEPGGEYWVRVLGGNDGVADPVSKFAKFTVIPAGSGENPTDPEDPETPVSVALEASATSATAADVKATGFEPGATIKATVGGEPAKFVEGRAQVDTVVADDNGKVVATIALAPGTVPAGVKVEVELSSEEPAASAKAEITGQPKASFATAVGSTPALGSTGTFTLENLSAGTKLSGLGFQGENFLKDDQRGKQEEDGKIVVENVQIPDNADLLGKELGVQINVGGATGATRFDTGLKVTPANGIAGEDGFDIAKQLVPSGLYQTAYSEKQNSVYVTRSVGRPPLKESTLYKLDADTLEEQANVTPAAVDGDAAKGLLGVYGIDVNDSKDQVWVTNTRQNTVAVYSATDLKLIKQFDAGIIGHPRDVLVDEVSQKVYVSAPRSGGENSLFVLDANNLDAAPTPIAIDGFNDAMSLDLDTATGDLYTVSLGQPKAAKIETRNDNKTTVWTFKDEEMQTGSGVAIDPDRKRLHITSQGTGNDLVVDTTNGQVLKNIPTGAGALNADYNHEDGVVYVANFGANTVSVIDAETLEIIASIDAGNSVNHVQSGKGGNVYAVNKGAIDKDGKSYNQVTKINKKGADVTPVDPSNPISSLPGSSSSNVGNIAIAIGGILGVGTLLGGIVAWAMRSGMIPDSLIPPQLRQFLR